MDPPRLLIVVPTLNSHLLLPRLLDSLQQQSWPDWQLLFIDGPSGPEHRQWLERCCAEEPRCRWIIQAAEQPGIFGAMNQGFAAAAAIPGCWLLFWGSDDWAASPTVLAQAMANLERPATGPGRPDLLVCRGRYVNGHGRPGRETALRTGARTGNGNTGVMLAPQYRRALLFGSTPPHQATLIGPGARHRLDRYAAGFRLSADLDYFLQLSRHRDLQVQTTDLELVHMADGGVSGQQTRRRLREVQRAYRRVFGALWWFPFLARYWGRLATALEAKR